MITIVNRDHLQYVAEEIGDQPKETIVIQPSNRETCAGILLPLLKINAQDPSSIVVILPSDHFIYPEKRFMAYVKEAGKVVDKNPEAIVMLGIVPECMESGYGWIERGNDISSNGKMKMYKVLKFWEKALS